MSRPLSEEIRLGFERLLRSVTQTITGSVSVTSSALPTGAASAANQSTIIGHLLTIIARLWNKGALAGNSSTTPLAAGASFTGTAVDVSGFASVSIALKTDQAGSGEAQFSIDGTNWDSAIPFDFAAGVTEQHRYSPLRQYFRVVITNTSASPQTYLRMQCLGGDQQISTSALGTVIGQDADTVVVRTLDFNLDVAKQRFQNHGNTIKSGLTGTIPNGSGLTEDVSTIGGAYTGFPSSPVAAEIVTTATESGTVYYSYMASSSDTDYTFASKDVTGGAGTYSLGHNIYRCNFAYFDGGSGGSWNAGQITIQSTGGGTNKFCRIETNMGESQCAAYTVPANSTVYLDMERASMRGNASGQLDGFWWYRENGKSPRTRWPFECQAGSLYFDEIDYLQSIPALTDVVPRITYSSNANQVVRFKFRFVKVKS